MSGSTVWLRTAQGARIAIGAAIALALVIGAGAAAIAVWPSHESAPVAVVAQPLPADTLLACDGPILVAGRVAEDAAAVAVAAPTRLVSGAADGAAEEEFPLEAPDVTGSEGVPALRAPVVERETQPVAGASSGTVVAPDLVGLAADACRPALFDSWLVGGAGTTGAADMVVLANPGEVAATVDITVYGVGGATAPPGGQDVTIGPRSQRVLPLAGLALGEEGPVIRIAAQGAPVRASLQSSLTRTLVPLGVDQTSALASPSLQQVIPGVVETARPGEAGASDASTILRVMAPATATTATVRVVSVGSGADAEDPMTVELAAGVPVDLELGGLDRGAYTVIVEADAETVAAVWQSAGADFAWLTSAPAVVDTSAFAVVAESGARLYLANPGGADLTVTISSLTDGSGERLVDVAAGSTERISVPAGSTWLLDAGGDAVHAAVVVADVNAVAGYSLWPEDAAAGAITVHP